MSEGLFMLEAGPLDDHDTVERLNSMIRSIRVASGSPYQNELIQCFMREMRRAMRRGLLEGGREIIERHGDPFYEEDELGGK